MYATMRRAMHAITILLAAAFAPAAAQPAAERSAWPIYRNERFGFALAYPGALLAPDPSLASDAGALFVSPDGKARLLASAGANTSAETLASYREFVLRESYAGAQIDYAPVRRSWFVLSGEKDGVMFYERITFACEGRVIYGWQMRYPAAERAIYDRVVERIHRSYQPGRGEDGSCG